RGGGLRRIEPQGRDAHALAGLEAVLAVGPLAVHAQLAFADDALDVGKRQPRKPRLKETIDPHVVLVRGDDDGLNPGGQLWFGLGLLLGFFRRCSGPARLVLPRLVLLAPFRPAFVTLLGEARGLAARPPGWTFGFPEVAIWARSFRAIARRCGSLDAAA